jgi:serine/threonine-protein kinase
MLAWETSSSPWYVARYDDDGEETDYEEEFEEDEEYDDEEDEYEDDFDDENDEQRRGRPSEDRD